MAIGHVLDPTALRTDDIASSGPDAGPLAGRTVGFRVDQMWRAWDWISEIWAEELRKVRVYLATEPKDVFIVTCGGSGGLHAAGFHSWGTCLTQTRAILPGPS